MEAEREGMEKAAGTGKANPRAALSLLGLSLKNIGPFDSAALTFLDDVDGGEVPVTIITGENGAGKSILIDAIRASFGEEYADLERPLWRPKSPFEIRLDKVRDGQRHDTQLTGFARNNNLTVMDTELAQLPGNLEQGAVRAPPWVVDFWRSNLATDSYAIDTFSPPSHRQFLKCALQGRQQNADVTKLLCYFDYLRDSRVPRERRTGEVLYETARKIVELSLLDGKLLEIARTTFTPMVQQGAQTVPLSALSSGNAYLIQRMIGLLGKMHAVNVLRDEDPERVCLTPGVLLLDEAENHLHPRWQKRFLGDVLRIFPNLQIVATTHSPFVVGSVAGARTYVCRYDRETRSATVENVTANYADLPVEEILDSAVFDRTESFGLEISRLMDERRRAVEGNDAVKQREIEDKLYEQNPRYFSYLRLHERLRTLKAG